MSAFVESITLQLPAIAATTPRGFGIAVANPFIEGGVICWFESHEAFTKIQKEAKHARQNGRDGYELRLADFQEVFETSDAAIRALLYGDQK